MQYTQQDIMRQIARWACYGKKCFLLLWIALLFLLNSSPASAASMHQWTRPALVQVMACCLFGAKPLPELMLAFCQLDSWEQISVKFKSKPFSFKKRDLKMLSAKMAAIVQGGRWVNVRWGLNIEAVIEYGMSQCASAGWILSYFALNHLFLILVSY